MRHLAIVLCAMMWIATAGGPVLAYQPDEVLDDPALEARARELSLELRCLVCQNQSIDDSDAPLARDLRILLRERLVAGDTNAQVIDYVVARYGEFVLLRPRLAPHTFVLWLAPAVILLLGGAGVFFYLRRRRPVDVPATETDGTESLTDDEKVRLEKILGEGRDPN